MNDIIRYTLPSVERADRLRRSALWRLKSELQALAVEADRIATLGDTETDRALDGFARSLEVLRERALDLKKGASL